MKNGIKLVCVNDSKQSILKLGQTYTALVRDGINSVQDVYIYKSINALHSL